MGRKVKDLSGMTLGSLTVLSRVDGFTHEARWLCRCTCGIERHYQSGKIICGTARCFCQGGRVKHGGSSDPLYSVWTHMNERCNAQHFQRYGGRGISVCPVWKYEFTTFRAWALANGWKRGLEIDRINNDGNYAPDNCRFVDKVTNSRNRCTNVKVTHNGQTKLLVEWAEHMGLQPQTINNRIHRDGWAPERAVSTPVDFNSRFQKGHNNVVHKSA